MAQVTSNNMPFTLTLTPDQYDIFKLLAKLNDQELNEYIHQCLLDGLPGHLDYLEDEDQEQARKDWGEGDSGMSCRQMITFECEYQGEYDQGKVIPKMAAAWEQTQADILQQEMEKDIARTRKRAKRLTRQEPSIIPTGQTGTGTYAGYATRQPVQYSPGVPLGLGGLTGAERRRRRFIQDYEQSILAYPTEAQAPRITERSAVRESQAARDLERSMTGELFDTSQAFRAITGERTGTSQRADVRGITDTISRVETMAGLQVDTLQTFKMTTLEQGLTRSLLDTSFGDTFRTVPGRGPPTRPPPPRLPRYPPFIFDFDDGEDRKKRRRRGRRGRYRRQTATTADPIRAIYGSSRQFRAIFGEFG